MFTRTQLDRYARHIILPGVGAKGQRTLLDSKVLVVGAGGLGSPVLLYLAAAGVGTLGLVEDDVVSRSNLQRQVLHGEGAVGQPKVVSAQARLKDLNPDVQVLAHPVRLSRHNALEILADYQLVIDGSDNFPTRYLVNDACVLLNKPLVYGAMSQFEGQVSLFSAATLDSSLGPCYRCLYPEPPPPGSVPSCTEAGIFGALPGVIGSLMAVTAIKHLLALGEAMAGKLLHYDALYSEFREVWLTRNPACPVCGDAPTIGELIDYEAFCGVT
jgi:adenylyltransferase/sulfurtransferase